MAFIVILSAHFVMAATQRSSVFRQLDDPKMKKSEEEEGEGKENGEDRSDKLNLAILLLLYTLQGIPMGLAGSVPMLLQTKMIGYRQQALFSLVSWPFSIKLLWAPVVDSFYNPKLGRRKSWLIPVQYVIGLTMILVSYNIDDLMGGEGGDPPNMLVLTILFFVFFLCAATQDIAVDGWAITMLSRKNVGHASTCNSVGQTAGYFLGYSVFLALESKEFCNTYLRSEPGDDGIVDMSHFFFFWGIVFTIVTTLIWLFKKEKMENLPSAIRQDVFSAYKQLLVILKLRPVQAYALFVLTSKVGFAAAENVTGLKLVEAGLAREKLAMIALPMVPIQILLPLLIR